MDTHSGYNQVPMSKKDEEKASFIMKEDTFCYTIMYFRVWDTRATFKRLMDDIFKVQLGQNVEAYINDILADLKETMHIVRKEGFQLKTQTM